jgi:hypothetical protein
MILNTFNFALSTTKQNTNYRVALAISGITQQFYDDGVEGRYSLIIN